MRDIVTDEQTQNPLLCLPATYDYQKACSGGTFHRCTFAPMTPIALAVRL